jgi:hypothetical protein
MKVLLAIAVGICAESAAAQSDLWHHASRCLTASSHYYVEKKIRRVTLPRPQQESVLRFLKARKDVAGCLHEDPTFFEKLSYGIVPLSPVASVVLVEAGPGCARGGQGANGSMWLVRFDGSTPKLIASPQEGFAGYVYSIEPTTSQGYRDIILGWHMSAFEAALSYFRFDGRSYHSISDATLVSNGGGSSRIVLEALWKSGPRY